MDKEINTKKQPKKANPKIDLKQDLNEKLIKYEAITLKALREIQTKNGLSEKEELIAKDFLSMAKNYFNDAKYFKEKDKLLISLAAFSYAHAWLDAGVRAGFFVTTNDQLFTLP